MGERVRMKINMKKFEELIGDNYIKQNTVKLKNLHFK
jgi:hypothetical protein